jgi:hypothetical protein
MILILIILILTSCSKSEVLTMSPQMEIKDTTYTPRVKADTNKLHPIRFDVHITDWEDGNV